MDNNTPTETSVNYTERTPSPSPPSPASCASPSENVFQFPPSDVRSILQEHIPKDNSKFVLELNESFQKNDLKDDIEKKDEHDEKSLLCGTLQQVRDYEKFTEYLQSRSIGVSSLEHSTDEAIKELSSLYSILDELSNIEETLKNRRLCLSDTRYLNEQNEKSGEKVKSPPLHDLGCGHTKSEDLLCCERRNSNKCESVNLEQRERSNSTLSDDIISNNGKEGIYLPLHKICKHKSTYGDGKSKVSKWTKVKAAFKWERATVPNLSERYRNDGCLESNIGLMPNNFEVARYLRVPSHACIGTSSTDSILSSSSGHLLNDIPTSSTLSSASSVDDVKASNNHSALRSKDEHLTNIEKSPYQNKPCCNKLLRKSKLINDFEVLPENVEANINRTKDKIKLPPSPLNLDQKQDLKDLEEYYIMQQFKSSKGIRTAHVHNNYKALNSPSNSSVPSSPSRLSDFFAELESEEVSSGDFSDPTTPNHIHQRKTYQQKQDEIHKKYEVLRKKLDMEFEAKQRKWEKVKAKPNICRVSAYTIAKSPTVEIMQSHNTSNLSTELLEESLSPDFKKKLQKWRVKKQERIECTIPLDTQPPLPSREYIVDAKTKIDWNLWKSGQIKLEGQGLSPLPYEKDLPEDFQRKLEQWNKIKKSTSMICTSEGLKRSLNHEYFIKRKSEDEKKYEQSKFNEKDKLDKLSKLKTIVSDHPSKEIEVKTSAGVMKFEGISRKFTRRLYEWEKSRGIGPESSTFALLHPGYCPLVVGRVSKECHKNGNSPTLSRSFSLDSMTPNTVFSSISKQASSLSLNDVNELKEREIISSNDALEEGDEFKSFDEPEAVIVEVEDHIEDTAAPLFTSASVVKQQTAVSKYEEDTCKDYCKARHVQSYNSCSSSEHMFVVLVRSQEMLDGLSTTTSFMDYKEDFLHCQSALTLVRNFYTYSKDQQTEQHVQKAVANVERQIDHFMELQERVRLDEACCQEVMRERCGEYSEAFRVLRKSLENLHFTIYKSQNNPAKNILSDLQSSPISGTKASAESKELLPITLEVPHEPAMLLDEDYVENKITVSRTFSNSTASGSKRKLRSRKLGSRQNSKTESSDSTDEDMPDTPRRWKRKNYRIKQRSFEEDSRKANEEFVRLGESCPKEDLMYMLRIKPEQLNDQCDLKNGVESKQTSVLISPNQTCVQLLPTLQSSEAVIIDSSVNSNIFVKTKRKIFCTIDEPHGGSGIAFVEQDLDCLSTPEDVPFLPEIIVPDKEEIILSVSKQSANNEILHDDRINGVLQKESINSGTTLSTLCEFQVDSDSITVRDIQSKGLHIQKCWSCFDFGVHRRCEIAKSCSVDSFISKYNARALKLPLATDSLEGIYKSCTALPKDLESSSKRNKASFNRVNNFRKYSQKRVTTTLSTFKSALVRKIEKKHNKTYNQTNLTQKKSPGLFIDQNDNFTKPNNKPIDLPYTENSEPDPAAIVLTIQNQKDLTPFTDRAQRLHEAKLEFLKRSILGTELQEISGSKVEPDKAMLNNPVTADSTSNVNSSSAIATMQSSADLGTAAGTSNDSAPCAPQHSGKHANKLSFISLATKLLRVRSKHDKKYTEEFEAQSEESLQKSKSSLAVLGRRNDKHQRPVQVLNKSRSDQYVLQHKANFA